MDGFYGPPDSLETFSGTIKKQEERLSVCQICVFQERAADSDAPSAGLSVKRIASTPLFSLNVNI